MPKYETPGAGRGPCNSRGPEWPSERKEPWDLTVSTSLTLTHFVPVPLRAGRSLNQHTPMSQYPRGSVPFHHIISLGQNPKETDRSWSELLASARLSVTETASEGTSFVPLAEKLPAHLVFIPNFTPTTLEVCRAGRSYFVPPGAVHAFSGLRDASELELRRADCEDERVLLLWAADKLST